MSNHATKIDGGCAKMRRKTTHLGVELLILHLNLQLSGNVQEKKTDS